VLYDTSHKYNIAHLTQLKVVLSNIFNLPSGPPGAKTLLADSISMPEIPDLRFAHPGMAAPLLQLSTFSAAINASCGMSTLPNSRNL
jgi:hypothetical protein